MTRWEIARAPAFRDETPVASRYDWAGRLISFGNETFEHDASSNLVRGKLNGSMRQFEYDLENRLQRVNLGEVVYRYDGDGNLLAWMVRGQQTTFVPDPRADVWRPLLAITRQGKQRFYLWDDRTPLGMVEDGKATFFLQDHLGSVRGVVDAAGKVAARRDYSPFCESSAFPTEGILFPASPASSGMATPGLSDARPCLQPRTGRFLQIDPQHRVPYGSQKDCLFMLTVGMIRSISWIGTGWSPR